MDETLHCCVLLCRTYLPSTGKILRFINVVLIVVQVYSFYAKVGLETTTMACPCPCQIVRPVKGPPDELVRVGSGSSWVVHAAVVPATVQVLIHCVPQKKLTP